MKITLPRLLSVALPLGAFSGLALATQSDGKLVPAYPPTSGRTTAAATAAPSSGTTQPLIATCLPAIKDQSGPGCIQASSVPTFGDLLPMSNYFNVTPAAQVGIGTIIGMHMGEEHRKEAEKHHINVVIAGHMASDSLGMNLFLDELEKKGIEVVPVSGLIRVKRKK